MSPTADGLAGRTTTTEYTGTARQAQDRVTEPASSGGLRGGAAAVPPRAAAAPRTSPQRSRERAAEGTPGPETAPPSSLLGQAAVRARVQTPAGASAFDSPPAGSRGLRGAEWQAAVKRAQRRQSGRGAPRAAAKVTAPPPVTGGAALTAVATCLGRCGWTAGPGDPAEVDKAANAHTKAGLGHPTNVVAEVAETGGAA